jgi:hypothetical protein
MINKLHDLNENKLRLLNFTMNCDFLEARQSDKVYTIFPINDTFLAAIEGKDIFRGTLYECLDACNNHYNGKYNKYCIKDFGINVHLFKSFEIDGFTLQSKIFNCLKLEEFVNSNPKNFIIEYWTSFDNINWNKDTEYEFGDISWHGRLTHSDPFEMSSCFATIDFTCMDFKYNSFLPN